MIITLHVSQLERQIQEFEDERRQSAVDKAEGQREAEGQGDGEGKEQGDDKEKNSNSGDEEKPTTDIPATINTASTSTSTSTIAATGASKRTRMRMKLDVPHSIQQLRDLLSEERQRRLSPEWQAKFKASHSATHRGGLD